MELSLKKSIRRNVRKLILNSPADKLITPLSKVFLEAVYLSRFSAWRHQEPQRRLFSEAKVQMAYEGRNELYEKVATMEMLRDTPIEYLEFGVFQGHSLRKWVELNSNEHSSFTGFDTFTGLPEAWGEKEKGSFSTDNKLPEISDKRVHFEVGLFQDTLPGFLAKRAMRAKSTGPRQRLVVHCDADLYSATFFVLIHMAPHLKTGDIILFDDFSNVLHEFRAFYEFMEIHPVRYDLLYAVNNFSQIGIKVL